MVFIIDKEFIEFQNVDIFNMSVFDLTLRYEKNHFFQFIRSKLDKTHFQYANNETRPTEASLVIICSDNNYSRTSQPIRSPISKSQLTLRPMRSDKYFG